MRHRVATNRLDRRAGHRKALLGNMVTSLFRYERIQTTKAKARVVRSLAEKMVTRAKVDSTHNRRTLARVIHDGGVVAKLFKEIGPRYAERQGGYTRILKLGPRPGDAAEMVILELVDRVIVEKAKPAKAKEGEKEGAKPEAADVEEPRATAEPKSEAEDSAAAKSTRARSPKKVESSAGGATRKTEGADPTSEETADAEEETPLEDNSADKDS